MRWALDKSLNDSNYPDMFMIALAAIAQPSAPFPTNPRSWARGEDVPIELLPENRSFVVGLRIVIDPSGKPQTCRLDQSSGIEKLDQYSCGLILTRARFEPAKGLDGLPAYGVYATNLTWRVSSDLKSPPPRPFGGDLELAVNTLPAGVTSPVDVRIMFAVDTQGQMSSCVAEPRPAELHEHSAPELVPIACEQLKNTYKAIPVIDPNGVPVASVQDAVVRFSVAAQ